MLIQFRFLHTGTANNAGAILVLGRDLVVVPKLIHPLPPAMTSPEASPERHLEDTWMQVLLICTFTMNFLSLSLHVNNTDSIILVFYEIRS